MQEKKFKYCAVGNIVKTHLDADGLLRYGTSPYKGGAKVYSYGKFWCLCEDSIGVIGLSRGKRYQYNLVPVHLIENIRCPKVYKPPVYTRMDDREYRDIRWVNSELAEKPFSFPEKWRQFFGMSGESSVLVNAERKCHGLQ